MISFFLGKTSISKYITRSGMAMTQDLNQNQHEDIFHSVTMTEEVSWLEGHSAGLIEGEKIGYLEGYHLGVQKGSDIGNEVGFYAGYAAHVVEMLHQDTSKSRILRVCESIINLANIIHRIEPNDESLTDHLNKIQGKFKQLTSQIGVQAEYKKLSSIDVKGAFF
ncbi:unnamed protein product [Lymnaea stagnalis]|uniref:Essential protein Yae1 N-terminal domain-containing protein n=1 Tax=Lymnaea stagnalis TaxID=6523 RepID=A0AAV2HWP5_LYMST